MRIGDTVIYTTSNKVYVGMVVGFGERRGEKTILITPIDKGSNVIVRMPSEVILLSVFFQQYKRYIKEL